jgi:hypothetical protein
VTRGTRSNGRTRAQSARNAPRPERAHGWGGARRGAGRPARHSIASEPHKTRPALAPRHPVHVTARVLPRIGSLRRRLAYAALRRAVITSLARPDFRIVRLALRPSRVELLVEADDRLALARGMQGFQVAAARALNAARSRRGTVFPDRYRPSILRTRRAVRAAIAALPPRHPEPALPSAPAPALTWLLRIELGRVRPRPRW